MFFLAKFIRDKAAKKLKKHSQEVEKPFLEHLEDLRKSLFKIIITVGVVTIGTFVFNKQLLWLIQYPLHMSGIPEEAVKLETFGAVEGMMLAIKVSLYAGIIIAFPLLMFFIGEFVMPGLKPNEKKLILPSLTVGACLFAGGVLFSYFVVIPRALEFFYGFSVSRGWGYELRAGYYISFAVQLVLVFGVCFELPVVVMAMVKLEILSHRVMRNTRSTAIIVMVIASAVITPTTDVFTLSFLAGPLIILYEICIWLAWWLEKKRARAEERERQRALPVAEPIGEPPADSGETGSESASTLTADQDHIDSDQIESSTSPLPYDPDNEFKEEPDISPDGEISSGDDSQSEHSDLSSTEGGENQDSDTADQGHDAHGDDYWNDPYHHDHHHDHHHDDYYSGPTEELKRELREELSQQIKAELKVELLAELRKELRAEFGAKPKRITLDPRRTRRPR